MSKLSIIVSGILLFVFLFCVFKIREESQFQKKYDLIENNVSQHKLINRLGNPTIETIYQNRKILIYEKGIGWSKYVFVFNLKNNLLISKNIDD